MSGLRRLVNSAGIYINRNSPSILTGLGVSGLIGAGVMAVRATPVALDIVLERMEVDYGKDVHPKAIHAFHQYSLVEVIPIVYKPYIPSVLLAVLGVSAIFLGARTNMKRLSTVTTAYGILDQTLRSYEDKIREVVSKTDAKKIQAAVDRDMLVNDPATTFNTHNMNGGPDLCYEPMTGRYFYTSADGIRRRFIEVNHDILSDDTVSYNEAMFDLGLPHVDVGNHLGWSVEHGIIEPILRARLVDPDDKPCLVVDFRPKPTLLWS